MATQLFEYWLYLICNAKLAKLYKRMEKKAKVAKVNTNYYNKLYIKWLKTCGRKIVQS